MTVTVPQIPLPVPSAADPENFPERGDAVVGALPAVIDGMNAQNAENNQLHGEIHDKVDEAMNAGLADAADNAAAANQAKLDAQAAVPLASAQADRAQAQADRAEQAAGEAGALPPVAGQNNKFLAVDGAGVGLVWKTVATMTGATAGAAGAGGLVPQPAAGQQRKVLHGDGTWGEPYQGWVTVGDWETPGTYSFTVTVAGWYMAHTYGGGAGGGTGSVSGGTSSLSCPSLLAVSATGATATTPGTGVGGDVMRTGGAGGAAGGSNGLSGSGGGGAGPDADGSPGSTSTSSVAAPGGASGGGLSGRGGNGTYLAGPTPEPGQGPGGGGGGGRNGASTYTPQKGGAGGGYASKLVFLPAGATVSVVVGVGGIGQTAIGTGPANGGNGFPGRCVIERLV